ncbi:hypothetical protein COU87_04400 [Candidatus Roizmanbacteria bacterium CG10_big_fil_rev_8_21_14_0_10_39_12]|uniref:Uncharacterized protein n=1 Tax=Candidatus Roizmanbacteria bacterium CG10_big_fil_rev_8_21_14_0_10_39_12 TaxID=1974852 RepID=A0A2M8KNK1_9BACT|nr:MAG: hypothetical protein COU87_04400 [Candidatus Roizmanbacteria bacterium CG10_big_fil_rev_8_21_14_0_10_39_12]
MPETQNDSQVIFQDWIQRNQNKSLLPPFGSAIRDNIMARERGWAEPYPGIGEIQQRLEALAEDNTLKGKVKQTAERVDEMLAPYSDQELLKKAAGAYERRKNNREAADPVNAPSWHDSLPDTTAPHHPPSHNQHTGTQPYSGQEVRNEITDRGAQDWLVRFRTQVVNLPEDELPGYAREQLSGVERDLEEIPQGDTATREAYIIARAQVEKSLAEQGWDVHGPEWQGASASTVSENYHVDAPQIVDPDAKVIKIENVGVYSKDPTKPEYSAIVMFRNPDGKVIYATIKDKNRAPSSRAMPPAHPFPSNPPSRVAHVINNASQRVQSATSTARGYVDRLTDIPGAPGVATGARQAARVATDALGDLTARFRRPSVGQQRAPIPEPHPKSVQNPVPDANPPIAPKPPETQPPDPIVEARKRYQQARVDFVGWARDDTNLRVLESYFRRLANIKNNKDTQIFVLANIPHIGILNPGESDNSGMFLINRTLGYLRFLDQQKVELNLAGEQLEAVNRIGRLVVTNVETLTNGHFLLPPENSTASPNRMSLDSYDDLIRQGYKVEIIGTKPSEPTTEFEVMHCGYYPNEQVLQNDFAIPIRLKYLPDMVQPQPPVPEPVPSAETTVAEAQATLTALEGKIPDIIASAQTGYETNYQALLTQLAAMQKKCEETGDSSGATDIRLFEMLLQKERDKFEGNK